LAYHAFTFLVGLFGRKKLGRRVKGVVYDSITKEPLALSILRVYNKETNKLVLTKVTDKRGGYDMLLNPGHYRLEVKRNYYVFPSKIVKGKEDGDYHQLYDAEGGVQVSEDTKELTIPDVPLDPVDEKQVWQTAGPFKRVWLGIQQAGNFLAAPVLIIGALLSLFVLSTNTGSALNWTIALIYIALLIMQLSLRLHKKRPWGEVYDVTSIAALPLTTIQLVDTQSDRVVKQRLTDYQGRYWFRPEPGKYVIKTHKDGYEQTEVVEAPKGKVPIKDEIEVKKLDQRITGDVGMKKLSH